MAKKTPQERLAEQEAARAAKKEKGQTAPAGSSGRGKKDQPSGKRRLLRLS